MTESLLAAPGAPAPIPECEDCAGTGKYSDGLTCDVCKGAASLAPAPVAAEPEGWKLVPIKPTGAMLHAAHTAFQVAAQSLNGFNARERAYAAMLDHVPAAPVSPSPAEELMEQPKEGSVHSAAPQTSVPVGVHSGQASGSAPSAGGSERECANAECGWRGETDRMCGSVGPLCPDCGEVTG